MDEIEKKQLYHTAWTHWGSRAQMDKCCEEAAELIQAIIHARFEDTMFSHSVFEEIADLTICMEQVQLRLEDIEAWDVVLKIKEQKLQRLHERLMASMTNKFEDEG